MAALNEFRLINDLYDNIALLDANKNLIFIGQSLRQILDTHKTNIDFLQTHPEVEHNPVRFSFETINTVLRTGMPASIKLDSSGIELLVIRCSNGVVLGLKEKIVYLTKMEHDLQERVKELEALYNISKEHDTRKSLDDFLECCTKHTQEGFQFPTDTIVNIELGNKLYGNTQWDPNEITDLLCAGIYLKDVKKGEIKVYIKNGLGYLEEEQKLIDEISSKISKIIEKEEETKYLEKQQKILTAKNEALVKLTEECYQKRENLRTFFRAISEKIIVIDRNFNLLMSNKDEIGDSGKCHKRLFDLDEKCKNCSAAETFFSGRDSISEEIYNEHNYKFRSYPILGSDESVERVLEVCSDITDQRNMEAQLIQSYKLASLGKLVAGVAHEINNPNTFILGNLKIVQEAFEDIFPIIDQYYTEHKNLKIARLNYEVFKENILILVNDMINGANRTKKIVGDLRNFAKKDEEGLTDVVDLNEIIKNNLNLTLKHIKKYAQLEVELNEKIPVFNGNIYKLEQVLLNLTMNASEAIEKSTGLIKIKTDYDEKNREVLLIVSDNGSGMDENTLKNIFDPFYTTKRNKGGTGLGLSITYGIIKDHKGKIEVNSKLGVGTTFTVRFAAK